MHLEWLDYSIYKWRTNGFHKASDLCAPLLALYFSWAKDPVIGAQLIDDLMHKHPTDFVFPSDGNYHSQEILVKAMMKGYSSLRLLLKAVHGTIEENTTICILLSPMPYDNVGNTGHLINGEGE